MGGGQSYMKEGTLSGAACPASGWSQASAILHCTGQCDLRVSKNACYFYPGRKQTA